MADYLYTAPNPTTPEMIERVARASFAHWRDNANHLGVHMDKGQNFEDMTEGEMRFALAHARTILAAMREPTEAMVAAADDYVADAVRDKRPCGYRLVFEAMIDAALGE